MRLVIDFDDFHFSNPENCLKTLYELQSKCSSIKISLFTTPRLRNIPLNKDKAFCKEVSRLIHNNTIKLFVHGLTHSTEEFKNLNEFQATDKIIQAEEEFFLADLKFGKCFKAPNWSINSRVIDSLIKLKYTHLYNHETFKHLEVKGIKYIYYNWNLKDCSILEDLIICHGHTHNVCENGIDEVKDKLLTFIGSHDVEFKFADEI